uniref:Peptidase A1 domain-containing protein n=2 Tax=Oryza TaxID=4527 RepID=A0A0D3EYF9_9ORYZ
MFRATHRIMPRAPEPVHVLLLAAIAVQVFVQCTAQAASDQKPLVSRLAQDYNTSLYTISVKNGAPPLVVDLAGTLVWSTCPSTHATVPCQSAACDAVNRQQPRRCRYVDGGWFWAGREPGSRCACTAHPFNPVTGECSTGDLTTFAMSANTTNGTDLLYPESFTAVGACAPERLLASPSLPQAAAGVAGFSGTTPLSLPSQLAAQRRFGSTFALCLPAFATFGDTPVYLPNYDPSGPFDYTKMLRRTPFLTNPRRNGGYYLPVKRISVSWRGPGDVPVSLPAGALDLDVRTGRGGVVLSTTTPYAIMRPDVFRAFAKAFDTVVARDRYSSVARVAGEKPFELCYGGTGGFALMKRAGYDAPAITLELGAGATGNWTILNGNFLVRGTCVGIVEMGPEGMPVDGEPAVVLGGMQLENILMVFDLDKRTLGFSRLLEWDLTNCYSASFLDETFVAEAQNSKCLLPPAIVSLVLLISCMVATGEQQAPYKPLVVPLVRDSDTSFYTIPIKNGAPLVVDLAGTLVWSTCPSTHTTLVTGGRILRHLNELAKYVLIVLRADDGGEGGTFALYFLICTASALALRRLDELANHACVLERHRVLYRLLLLLGMCMVKCLMSLIPPATVSLVLLLSCLVATGDQQPAAYKLPLIVPLVRDTNTSLYTIAIKKGDAGPLVVDLAGALVWSTCPSTHATVSCLSGACGAANQQQPRRCRYVDGGWFWSGREPGSRCACTAHPFNPVTGECSTGDLTSFAMSANTTSNGTKLLYQEAFATVGACAPERLLASLPAGATGVAGFSRRPLSLPSQLAAQRNFGNKFALCMSQFVAFGDAPVYLGMEGRGFVDYREILPYTPLLTNPRIPGYYLPVKGISVSWSVPETPASLPAGALDLDARTGRGGVVLSTTTPYTVMRPDVFRAFAEAFDTAIIRRSKYTYSNVTRHPPVGPFKLCYNGAFPMLKRPASMDIPTIHLELDGATGTWSWFNDNYLVFAPGAALCVGVLEMGPGGMPVDGEPAMVVGVKQLDWNLLVFDLDKMLMWFSGDLAFRLAGIVNYTESLPYTPLLTNPRNPGYYLPVKGITVSWYGRDVTASLPADALNMDARTGRGGVVLSTTTPYAVMRPDVFRAFAEAFDAAIRGTDYAKVVRVPAVEPFKLCYDGAFPFRKRPPTWDVPTIDLELAGATGIWRLFTENYMVQTPRGMCVGILEMEAGGGMPVDGEPAMVLGLKQLDTNLLVFDLDKMLLWFSGELSFRLTGCVSPF